MSFWVGNNQLPPNQLRRVTVFPKEKIFPLCVCMSACLFFGPPATKTVLKLKIITIFWAFLKTKKKIPSSKQKCTIDFIFINILNFKKAKFLASVRGSQFLFLILLHSINVIYLSHINSRKVKS